MSLVDLLKRRLRAPGDRASAEASPSVAPSRPDVAPNPSADSLTEWVAHCASAPTIPEQRERVAAAVAAGHTERDLRVGMAKDTVRGYVVGMMLLLDELDGDPPADLRTWVGAKRAMLDRQAADADVSVDSCMAGYRRGTDDARARHA